jgi:hypothetical protein
VKHNRKSVHNQAGLLLGFHLSSTAAAAAAASAGEHNDLPQIVNIMLLGPYPKASVFN